MTLHTYAELQRLPRVISDAIYAAASVHDDDWLHMPCPDCGAEPTCGSYPRCKKVDDRHHELHHSTSMAHRKLGCQSERVEIERRLTYIAANRVRGRWA